MDDNNHDELDPRPRASSAAFTIDFGEGRNVDLERHKSLVERYQKRHRRGLSASKLEENSKPTSSSSTTPTAPKKLGFIRKSSSSVEGSSYDVSSSEDQRSDRAASTGPTSPLTRKLSNKRERLSLPLKSAPGATERMVQSFTDYNLNGACNSLMTRCGRGSRQQIKTFVKQLSSPECEMRKLAVEEDEKGGAFGGAPGFTDGAEFDFDRRSDTVSETGTYTIDADVYTTEQKERMSIDRDFRILDPVAGTLKVAEYVSKLAELNGNGADDELGPLEVGAHGEAGENGYGLVEMDVGGEKEEVKAFQVNGSTGDNMVQEVQNNVTSRPKKPTTLVAPLKPHLRNNETIRKYHNTNNTSGYHQTNDLSSTRYVPNAKLSPILSPTQQQLNDVDNLGKTFTKIMFPSSKGGENGLDQGSVISVTSSGAFRARNDLQRKSSLTKSDIYVEAYTDHQMELRIKQPNTQANTLSANLVHMTSTVTSSGSSNLPPSVGGKSSPTKIPSPRSSYRPRSRNCNNTSSNGAANDLETECYLRPTQQLLSQLENTEKLRQQQQQVWNNECYDLVKTPVHVRHNSLDGRCTDKLEHFQRKNNLLCIDQTCEGMNYGGAGGGAMVVAAVHNTVLPQQSPTIRKVQNSPNNSPIRRSSSFSAKHNQQQQQIVVNRLIGGHQSQFQPKDMSVNVRNSPILLLSGTRNTLQKSASTTNIKPLADGRKTPVARRGSTTSNEGGSDPVGTTTNNTSPYHHHQKIDRSKYGDTESSSEDDVQLHQTLCAASKRKEITSTRYNRAFSLRRGRLDGEAAGAGAAMVGVGREEQKRSVRCPNTPEMRRKFAGGGGGSERATSVDRKPSLARNLLHDTIQSRYLQSASPTTTNHHSLNNNSSSNSILRNARHGSAPPVHRRGGDTTGTLDHNKQQMMRLSSAGSNLTKSGSGGGSGFSRVDPGRFSTGRGGTSKPMTNSQKTIRLAAGSGPGAGGGASKEGSATGPRPKQPGPRSNSSLSSKEMEFANWKRRKGYDPMKAAAEGKKRAELIKKQVGSAAMTQSYTEATNPNSCDSSPSHSSSVHRSQSFHGTAATPSSITHHNNRLLLSSGDEAEDDLDDSNEDLTLSAEEDYDTGGFSPPTPPSPSQQHYPSPWRGEMQRQNSSKEEEGGALAGQQRSSSG